MEYDLGLDTVTVKEGSAISEVAVNGKPVGSCWFNSMGNWTATTHSGKAKQSGFSRRIQAEGWLVKRYKGFFV